jgi:putative two-component system hydrogenase maturation factor HypX/HoxX
MLLCSSFNGLSQRFFVELSDAGHTVNIHLLTDDKALCEILRKTPPDIIISPFLKRAIPAEICNDFQCFILHPGIIGDRGPCSLDWAILEGWNEWGVTLLQANDVMDAGDIWATRIFPLRTNSKSRVYRQEVTDAAVECLWELIGKLQQGVRKGHPLNYGSPEVRGRERRALTKVDRTLNWQSDPIVTLMRKIGASDSTPGAISEILGVPVRIFNVWQAEDSIACKRGRPGEVFARSGDAICISAIDGALWVGHLRRTDEHPLAGIKLPALISLSSSTPSLNRLPDLIVSHPNQASLEKHGRICIIHFPYLNGAFNERDSIELLRLFNLAKADVNTDVIILAGGNEFWSNGIDLNSIQSSVDPARAGWESINAIDDLAEAIFLCKDKLVLSAVNANAGAGGAMLMLACDQVIIRSGVILNPHYQTMGLFGSELWTMTLPHRVGMDTALSLTEECMPLSANKAKSIGMVDKVINAQREDFLTVVLEYVYGTILISNNEYANLIHKKLCVKESLLKEKSINAYRDIELSNMKDNFFSDNLNFSLHRNSFVMKHPPCQTPAHLLRHNEKNSFK